MDIRTKAAVGVGALGVIVGLLATAPSALADPEDPTPPPPGEVQHLSSPQNLPPGTTDDPGPPQSAGLSYLQEVWYAIQSHDITMGEAMLLLAQRPMDPNATPPPGLAPGPQPPPGPAPGPQPPPGQQPAPAGNQ
ncbi:MAG: dopamine receptor D4 [Mycobacteriaceae bacterium]|nr:dopamine receptor D4 [Mycobacteriaceae bacterium]